MRTKNKLIIPLEKVPERIDLCLHNASQFCAAARALSKESSIGHALGLCLYAIEELGKAELLNQLAFSAKKYGDKVVTLERAKPKKFFNEAYHSSLDKLGFSKDMNPFYDHRFKLFSGRGLLGLALN